MSKFMVQGTSNDVGKSTIIAALCRIFIEDGISVFPYKFEDISNESYINLSGREISKCEYLKCVAAGVGFDNNSNPFFLKKVEKDKYDLFLNGDFYKNVTMDEYDVIKEEFMDKAWEEYNNIKNKYNVIIIEEHNNMGEMILDKNLKINYIEEELYNSPSILIGNGEKTGVFPEILGNLFILDEKYKGKIKGTIINKCKLKEEYIKNKMGKFQHVSDIPNLGVIPYKELKLNEDFYENKKVLAPIDIGIIKLPEMVNNEDIEPLYYEEDVSIRFITSIEEFKNPDILIIPHSKNVIKDILYMRKIGLDKCIKDYYNKGIIFGICSGLQILGEFIEDPNEVYSPINKIEALGLLKMTTILGNNKDLNYVFCRAPLENILTIEEMQFPLFKGEIYGHRINLKEIIYGESVKPLFYVKEKDGKPINCPDGAVNAKGNVMGTFTHDIFSSIEFKEYIINILRKRKGLGTKKSKYYESNINKKINCLANLIRENINVEQIYELLKL